MQATALNRHRASAIDLDPQPVRWTLPLPARGTRRLFRWEPWVRSYLIAQEMLRPLDFSAPADNTACLHVRDGSGKLHELVKIIAPPPRVFAGDDSTEPPTEGQVHRVLQWAELRDDRQPEILAQVDDCLCFWSSLVPVQSDRMRRTREVLEAAVQLAVFVEMRFKHDLACWRPIDYSAQVQPMIPTPGHGSLPSGHCTQAYVVYEVLRALLNATHSDDIGRWALNQQFSRLAERIAMNRVVAGVHFPVDNIAGRLLGTVVGRYFAHRAGGRAELTAATFDGNWVSPHEEFDPVRQTLFPGEPSHHTERVPFYETGKQIDLAGLPGSDAIDELWESARNEVQGLGLVFS